ncbi:MAG: hypothetical protein ACEPOZ_14635 [Marinifilaceae bacterium]|jgi:predicted Zn-ribbon and HTH transcriptional regulator
MGHCKRAVCRSCGFHFQVEHGGGFFFHLLRCDQCGETKDIGFDQLGEIHLAYLKGLGGPYCVATMEQDKYIRENYQGKAISLEEYHSKIERLCGQCQCGGQFRFNAQPRCPECKSTEIEEGEKTLLYD